MDIAITEFRRAIFEYVSRAIQGEQIRISYRGQSVELVPELRPGSRLERISRLQVVNPTGPPLEREDWKREMVLEWEKDWADL